jgi:hypothetical protein
MYVIGTWVLQFIALCACGYCISGLSSECVADGTPAADLVNGNYTGNATAFMDNNTAAEPEDEDATASTKDDIMLFCATVAACAIVHSAFAFYIQRRLVRRRAEDSESSLSAIVWYLLKYDIGFCLYCFFAAAAPAFLLYTYDSLATCSGGDSSRVAFGTGGAIFIAVSYAVLEFFYMCCFACGGNRGFPLESMMDAAV